MNRLSTLFVPILALAWCVPAHATWGLVQSPAQARCTTGSTCFVTTAATGTGNLIVVGAFENAGGTVSSCCNAGCAVSWVRGPHNTNTNSSAEIWYCTSSSSGATSIGPTWTGTNCASNGCNTDVVELSSSLGTIAIDSGATPACNSTGSSLNPTTCSLTVSSNNDVYFANMMDSTSNITALGQSYTLQIGNSRNGRGYKLNQTSYTAPQWTAGATAWVIVAAAFQETGAGGTTVAPQLMMTGAGD